MKYSVNKVDCKLLPTVYFNCIDEIAVSVNKNVSCNYELTITFISDKKVYK